MDKTELSLKIKIYKAHINYAKFCEQQIKDLKKQIEADLKSAKKSIHIKMRNIYSERAFKTLEEAISFNKKAEKEYKEALMIVDKYSLEIITEQTSKDLKLVKLNGRKLMYQKRDMEIESVLP